MITILTFCVNFGVDRAWVGLSCHKVDFLILVNSLSSSCAPLLIFDSHHLGIIKLWLTLTQLIDFLSSSPKMF